MSRPSKSLQRALLLTTCFDGNVRGGLDFMLGGLFRVVWFSFLFGKCSWSMVFMSLESRVMKQNKIQKSKSFTVYMWKDIC